MTQEGKMKHMKEAKRGKGHINESNRNEKITSIFYLMTLSF